MNTLINSRIPEQIKSDFITGYCLFNMCFGAYTEQSQKQFAFRELASIFRIDDDEWLDTAYSILSSKIFSEASDEKNFKKLSRVIFASEPGMDTEGPAFLFLGSLLLEALPDSFVSLRSDVS